MIKSIFSGISSPLPNIGKGGVSLLLALCCCAGLSAQATTDPFPAVNYNLYSDNMTFFGQVRLDGEVQPDGTIVAVYCGDEIRGKGEIKKQGRHEHCARFNISGEKKGDPLHFKVFTGGRVIEVDQGATFLTNDKLGSVSAYYYIDLPVPVVTNSSSEGWSTTCLPFNAEIPDGVTVYAATGVEDSQLKVAKYEGKVLPANTPVLLESTGGNSFEWLSRVAADEKPSANIFKGTTEKTDVEAGTVYTLGHESSSGKIGFWLFSGTAVPANRAYLADIPTNVKGFTWGEDDADGISLTPEEVKNEGMNSEKSAGAVYDLQGRNLSTRQLVRSALPLGSSKNLSTLPKGIYVKNGQKFVVK